MLISILPGHVTRYIGSMTKSFSHKLTQPRPQTQVRQTYAVSKCANRESAIEIPQTQRNNLKAKKRNQWQCETIMQLHVFRNFIKAFIYCDQMWHDLGQLFCCSAACRALQALHCGCKCSRLQSL